MFREVSFRFNSLEFKSFGLFICFLLIHQIGASQIRVPSFSDSTGFHNSISFGPSYGQIVGRNATFWGVSCGYSRKLSEVWALSGSVAYDKEREKREIVSDQVIQSYTAIGTISYLITPRLSLTSGLAKGFLDDDNTEKRIMGVDGDWATGISLGYSLPDFPFWSRESFAISGSYEYNFSQKEFSFSFDLVMGLSW